MRFLVNLFKIILFLISIFYVPSVFAAPNQYITVVNPIRGGDFWQLKDQKPVDNVKNQWQEIAKNNLSATWLVRPDALEDEELTNLLKTFTQNQEIGLFMEVTPTWAKLAGVAYHQNTNWHSAGSVFLTGYSVEERGKLIDTAFFKFKDKFGSYPKSVGAWWIDAGSLTNMREKYGILANMDVADQYTTDNYSVWGQYFSLPFYPALRNALVPASGQGQKIGVVTIQWATRDPFNSYGNGVLDSTYSVQANDYANKKYHSLTTDYFRKILSIYLDNPYVDLGQVTVGIENDFSWQDFGSEFSNQIKVVSAKKNRGVRVLTMSDFALDYQKFYPIVSPSQIIFSDDPLNSGGKVLWYQTPKYRAGWFENRDGSVIRDLRLYHESVDEPCFMKACSDLNLSLLETEHLDEVTFGDRWIIDEGKITNVVVKKIIDGVEITYTNQSGRDRKITFLPNDVKIDNSSLPIDVAISQAISNGKNPAKIENQYNYQIGDLGKVLSQQLKNFGLFILFGMVFFYLPGLAILQKTNLEKREKYILSWPLGICIFTLLAFAFGYLHFYWGLLILPVMAIIIVKKDFILYPFGGFNLKTVLLIFLGSLSWFLTTVKNGLSFDYGLGFWGAHGHDAIWHLSLIESAKRGLPLENFSFSGTPLANYHYFYDLLLAVTSRFSQIPGNDLYFRMFPFLISLLIGLVGYILVKRIFDEKSANLTIFFLYFGGSFGWIVSFIRDRSLGGESLFWAQQGISTLINPPLAISFLIFLTGLYFFSKVLEQKDQLLMWMIPLTVVWGSLMEFKAYGGMLILGALFITSVYEILRGHLNFLKISIPIALLQAIVFLPNNLSSSGLLVFQPFWLIHSMVDSADRLNWIRLSNARILGFDSGNYFKFVTAEIIGFLIFVFGNLGTRFFGFMNITKIKNPSAFKIFISAFTILSLAIPLLFIQKGASFNTVQFFYYFLLIFDILAAVSLSKISFKFRGILIGLVILLTIPTSWDSLNHFLPIRPPAMIPIGEAEALNFLKSQPDGIVLSYYYDNKNHQKYEAPQPLFAYRSTPYVSAFSGKPEFIADTVNLDIIRIDYKGRFQIQKDIFSLREQEVIKNLLRENNISYIYAPKIANFNPDEKILGIERIFGNSDVDIFRIQ